jgi:hypothetical protein
MRGRLIFPFGIEIRRLDGKSTQTDSLWREPKLVGTTNKIGKLGRKELDPVVIPGQFAVGSDFMALQMLANGNASKTDFKLIFHFADLEERGLVEEATGTSLIRVGDRLSAVYNIDDETLIQAVPDPPGAFIKEAEPRFGLGRQRNLLICTFVSRDQGQS